VAGAEYTTTAKLPVDRIWDFVKEMDNWAEFVTGYQSHEKQNETDSVWVLKGDVGVLARTIKFHVHITEWNGPSRVAFDLKGVNEAMEGGGTFEMESFEEGGATAAVAVPAKKGWLQRLFEAIARFFLGLVGGGQPERAATADAGPGAGMSKLTFRLEVNPAGPMAPMVNAMMKPVMLPAAEQLANAIMGRLEEKHAPQG